MRRLLLSLFFVVFALGSCGSQDFRGSVLEESVTVPDFSLSDEEGGTFRLSEQRGNVVLLFFGYTQCPDVCPTTLATWRTVHEILGDDAERVRFVFVTVDPERDTVERLALHVNAFNPEFIGLTGSQEDLEAVYEVFNIVHEKDTSSGSAAGYLINHTATAFVIDPEGQWRLRETYGTEAEDIAHDIELLLD